MEQIKNNLGNVIPDNIDNAIKYLAHLKKEIVYPILKHSEGSFLIQCQLVLGNDIIKKWKLKEKKEEKKNNIIKEFNSLGIYESSDMSGIMITGMQRHLNKNPVNMEQIVSVYKKIIENNEENSFVKKENL